MRWREAGIEVVYTGIRQTPEDIVEIAGEEGVDALGLSILSGAHMELFPQIVDGLDEAGLGNVVIVAGGIIPEEDRLALREMGVLAVFGPGSPTTEIAKFIKDAVAEGRQRARQC